MGSKNKSSGSKGYQAVASLSMRLCSFLFSM